jgi:hyperosmotically inducible periplasmic protein
MKHRAMLGILAAVAVVVLSLGCRNTAEGVKQDSKENAAAAEQKSQEAEAAARRETEEAKAKTADERAEAKDDLARTGEKVGDAAQTAGDKISGAAKTAGDKVSKGAHEVAPALDAAKQTLDVKAALMADQTVDASNIDVDTDETTKTVHLKGSVPTAAQKTEAEKIARSKAAGYTIHNMLTVAKKS